MQIRAGDSFHDGKTTLQVYGFRIDADSDDGRKMLVVTQAGEKSEVDPWDLYENCDLIPAMDRDALVCFDSGELVKSP